MHVKLSREGERSPKNPLGLAIGQRVVIKAEAKVGYGSTPETHDTKSLTRVSIEPRQTFIVGTRRVATGERVSGDDISRFNASNYHRLYECREAMGGKITLAHPGDIEGVTKIK